MIGAISSQITPFIKDLYIHRFNDKRKKSDGHREIFRNYTAPLVGSCEKLLWRFSEIFIENRHHFLKLNTLPLVFNEYKRMSTLYRIASLLGWIRAINLELNALPRGASGYLTPISKAISEIQRALADGPHVELHRLEQACNIWRIDISQVTDNSKKRLAAKFEVELYKVAGDELRSDSDYIRNLSAEKKIEICESLSNFLCSELKRTKIDGTIIRETINQATSAISYREALIYRDWQDAIGDSMLEPDPDSVRRFKIITYKTFSSSIKEDNMWINVFRSCIDDIDFESIDPNDFRGRQLESLCKAVSGLILAIAETDERDLIDTGAMDVAKSLKELK
ncbi:hypothetical protein AZA_88469 [Nitrospirillum viridazoti Y2]|nr:hypothetical protein AZA_88469 [Nitrospirillum amazonense Y2]